MKWFLKCIKNYVNFAGRARRREFWMFSLFSFIFVCIAATIDWMLLGPENAFLQTLVNLFLFLPSLAVTVRRLHDTGRSGVNLLLYLIFIVLWSVVSGVALSLTGAATAVMQGEFSGLSPILLALLGIGGLICLVWSVVLIVWYCFDGEKGDNKYGPDPKAAQE